MAILHQLQGLQEVKAALPAESQKAAVLFFPAAGVTVPKASAAFDWPSGEEEIVLELLRFTEKVGVPLSVQNAELMCRSLVIRPRVLFGASGCFRFSPWHEQHKI